MEHSVAVMGHYNYFLVLVSISIAMMSAYATLDLTERLAHVEGRSHFAWLICGAVALGTGIWSMHYIGMLAFQLPVKVKYDGRLVLLSLVAAVLASGCGLFCVGRRKMGTLVTIAGSVFMGSGIAAMHYIGMAAMLLPATCIYNPVLVVASVLVAIAISFVALWRAFALRRISSWSRGRIFNAFILGAAIPATHYIGMAACHFVPGPFPLTGLKYAISNSDLEITGVALITVVMLGLVFITTAVDRNFGRQALALKGSEQRYRRIVESTFDAFLAMGPGGQITDWNTQAEAMFGWSRSEAIGKNIGEVLLWEKRVEGSKDTLQNMLAIENAGLQERIEVMAIHRDGYEFATEVAMSSLQIKDTTLFAAVVQDVTKRKKAEREKEEAMEAAERANRVKGEFLANMSHEIRTPLNGVIGMTDLALETELNREQRDYLETIKLSADSLLSVINAILDFSKIEVGKMNLEEVEFDLRECMEAALRTLALQADEKGLELLCEVGAEIPDTVKGDAGRLRQILVNLVGNAIKFTYEGEVALKVQLERTAGARVTLHFVVSDTGIGIAEDKLEAIFESFAQADTSTTREFGGTGLGLTISRRLVELMGGEIWIESELGTGSHFHFTVDLERSEQKPVKSDVIAPLEMLLGVRVLVIDDNRTNRRILDGLLRNWGMEPLTVSSAAEALDLLTRTGGQEPPFQLIVTDRHMPKMDGFGMIEKLQQLGGSPTTTIMMLSSAGHGGDTSRCQELGIAAYLLKPVRKMELREAIAKVLMGKDSGASTTPIITRDLLDQERDPSKCLNILLAEDNLVNQKLALRLLEKRGHAVTVVGNGRDALYALGDRDFDLVLMDVQMPELDGISATIQLRAKEKLTGKHQVVVAMTALAMKSDRERCQAAGMDGYLAKPIRGPELDEVLETRVMEVSSAAAAAAEIPVVTHQSVNADELLERLDGDHAFLAELTDLFRCDYPRQIQAIREGIEQNDTAGVKQASHALKGALFNLSAIAAGEMATRLEGLGVSGDWRNAKRTLHELEAELTRTMGSLDALCRQTVP